MDKENTFISQIRIPVGNSNFQEIREKDLYYVDKTGFISELLNYTDKVQLITRPRRFGKTLMMSMLKCFFDIEQDNRVLFSGLEIGRNKVLCAEWMNQCPVVFLTFKEIEGLDFESAYDCLKDVLAEIFNQYSFILDADNVNDYDRKLFTNLQNGMASKMEVKKSLKLLTRLLYAHYNKQVIILLDEYDVPLAKAHERGYYEEMLDLMRGMLQVLKDNDCLNFAVLTGCLRVSKESVFTGVNNFSTSSIISKNFNRYFGFTEKDVQQLLKDFGMSEQYSLVKEWYDGYMFGRTGIYNPWSVINYFNNKCVPKAFWSRTSGNEIIGELFNSADTTFADNLLRLLQGSTVQAIVDTDIIYPEINGDIDTIYSFLLVAGYLRVSEHIGSLYDNPICALSIPNYEIKSVFQKEIIDRYNGIFTGALLRNFAESIRTGNAHLLTETLQQYLLQSASVFDTAHEDFYHGVVFGMLAVLSDNYYISSNRESGEGRFDIELQPKSRGGHGYIIEFKACKEAELEKMAGSAVRQIQQKSYTANLEKHGVSGIGMFGVAFSGKKVSVAYEEHDVKKRKSRE